MEELENEHEKNLIVYSVCACREKPRGRKANNEQRTESKAKSAITSYTHEIVDAKMQYATHP